MTALHISPDEIWPRFDTSLEPPRPGAPVKDWIAYRARVPRLSLPAPVVLPWMKPKPVAQPAPATIFEEEFDTAPIGVVDLSLTPEQRVRAIPRPAFRGGRPPIAYVIRCCAAFYGITTVAMIASNRAPAVTNPRQIAMFLLRELTAASLPEIGRRVGGRDHTTALHACRKIEAAIKRSPALRVEIGTLAYLILGSDA